MFSGLDFTSRPNRENHQSKLLKYIGRLALSLFYFYRYWSSQIVRNIIAYLEKECKPDRASPDLSPVLKYGVFLGDFYKTEC